MGPNAQAVRDWLVDRLGQTYPMLAGRTGAVKAASLLASGKITVILDGLDEIPAAGRRSQREPGGAGDAGRLLASFLAARHAGSHSAVAGARVAVRLP